MFRTLWADFRERRLAMKVTLLVGWLCVVIMLGALLSPYFQALESNMAAFGS